jgi:hypothetical protein
MSAWTGPYHGLGQTGWRLWGKIRFAALDRGFALFNQPQPYTGSIISINGHPKLERTAFTGPGLYFRSFKFPVKDSFVPWDGRGWWTLIVSRAYPAGLCAILPPGLVDPAARAAPP